MIDIEAGVDKDGNRFIQVLQDRWIDFIRAHPLTYERYILWEQWKRDYLNGKDGSNE